MKRRRLGQHYLTDAMVVRRMVSLAEIGPEDRVVEIGTGRGALTRELADLGASFEGYEIDRSNHAATLEAVRGTRALVTLGDAFEHTPRFDVLVSSLRYSESARFVRWLCGVRFRRAVVLMQEDFAAKMLASPGARDYRGISALAQLAFDARVVERVKRESFAPQPRVSSVMVMIVPRQLVPEREVANIMRLFSLRRRRIDSALPKLGMEWGPNQGARRVSSLTPDEVHEICDPRRRP